MLNFSEKNQRFKIQNTLSPCYLKLRRVIRRLDCWVFQFQILMIKNPILEHVNIDTYKSMHQKARLGVNDDNRKKALSKDERLEKLKKMATISTMHASQLVDFQNHLANLTPEMKKHIQVCRNRQSRWRIFETMTP